MMKRMMNLLAAVVVVALSAACSDDNSEPKISEGMVAGKWNYSSIRYAYDGTTLPNTPYTGHVATCARDHVELSADGSAVRNDFGIECALTSVNGSWSLTGTELTIVLDGISTAYELTGATATELRIARYYTEDGYNWTEITTFARAEEPTIPESKLIIY